MRNINIQGARTHNLKNISCDIPHGLITVITGPSGSGKSSLAFDTLYAEGQRRFLESMSTYARQFLERIEKPDLDQINNVLPAIALEQKNYIKNARSTVGTVTEIYDFLRLLFATIGATYCDKCDGIVKKATPASIEHELRRFENGTKIILTTPISTQDFSVQSLLDKGYFRAWTDEEIVDITNILPEKTDNDILEIIIDRLILKGDNTSSRLFESIRKGLELNPNEIKVNITGNSTTSISYQTRFACQQCHKVFEEPFPNLFSFNNPMGACKSCEGFGKIIGLDLNKVIPNRKTSLREGAIHPFNTPSNHEILDLLISEGEKLKIRLDIPFEELSDAEKIFVLDGKGAYPGVYQFFNWLESKKYKVHVRVLLAKYRGYYPCPDCHGSRLRPEAHQVRINNYAIHALCNLSIHDLISFFHDLTLSAEQLHTTDRIMREIRSRLDYLQKVGLGYLTLSRQSRTLSGGESQRINLASALGSALTDTMYVMDEPTVGLHARDTKRLLAILQNLRDMGNTIVVVEHDPEIILGADRVIDMGPDSGEDGGYIVYEGDVKGLLKTDYSKTALFLNNPPQVKRYREDFSDNPEDWIEIQRAYGNNLKNIDVRLPKNRLVCISGVSGSGKSTLIKQTLYANYQQEKGNELTMDVYPCFSLKGLESFEDIILVDQTPPGRSIRSNPVTYVKAYDEIRKLFASTRKAQALGITAGHFSFNSPGGRCETCEGLGIITIDMQFMADVTVTCNDCQGKRFSSPVLAVEWEGITIDKLLDLTVTEAVTLFKSHKKIVKKLNPLIELGLGYLKTGQSTSTLSGGEAQRLKLASFLSNETKISRPYLFLFDEPTTGLHLTDINVLLGALRKLLNSGHSIIVVEHNIELLLQADYIADLGPDGGDDGGRIVAQGSIDDIMACSQSYTGQFLKHRLLKDQAIPIVYD